MSRFNGIGDMLEDDVEHIHQKAAKIESRIGRMKNKEHQAIIHSRLEALQNSREIREAMESSISASKRNFKKCNLEHSAEKRKVKAKIERDSNRMASLSIIIASKPHETVPLSNYDKHKNEFLRNNS
jgi:esterase/lipase